MSETPKPIAWPAARSGWIVDGPIDALFFWGPAAVVLGVFAVAVSWPRTAPLWLWGWILALDGPHMAATYARTYADASARRSRARLLLTSLLAFAIGPALLVLPSRGPFLLFLAAMSVYGVHHVIRQHWGFVAIYRGRASSPIDLGRARWTLRVGCWAPYLAFLVTHPAIRAVLGLPPPRAWGLMTIVASGCAAAAAGALGVALWDRRRTGARAPSYIALAIAFHAVIYFALARLEPVYAGARGPDQVFMMLAVAAGSFHSIQYVALVAIVRARGATGHAARADGARANGARTGRRVIGRLALGLASFSLAYGALAALTGLYPGPSFAFAARPLAADVTAAELAIAIWNGIALHHYLVDARIWRLREDPELARSLALA